MYNVCIRNTLVVKRAAAIVNVAKEQTNGQDCRAHFRENKTRDCLDSSPNEGCGNKERRYEESELCGKYFFGIFHKQQTTTVVLLRLAA